MKQPFKDDLRKRRKRHRDDPFRKKSVRLSDRPTPLRQFALNLRFRKLARGPSG